MILVASFLLALQSKGKPEPAPGQVFHFNDPKWVTADVEFRDAADEQWPCFFYGRPVHGGTVTFDRDAPKIDVALECDRMAQFSGSQERKVLAPLLRGESPPTVSFRAESMKPLATEEEVTRDSRGREKKKSVVYAPVSGTLKVGSRSVPVSGKAYPRYRTDRKDKSKIDSVYFDMSFTISGADIGVPAAKSIAVRVGLTAEASTRAPRKSKK